MAMVRQNLNMTSVTVDTVLADSDEIPFEKSAGGQLYVPTGSSLTTLTWHTAENDGGTFLPAYDADGVAVTQTVTAAGSYPFPTALFGCAALKITGNADGTVHVNLKA